MVRFPLNKTRIYDTILTYFYVSVHVKRIQKAVYLFVIELQNIFCYTSNTSWARLGNWCTPWSSKPVLGVRSVLGGFDSHTRSPKIIFIYIQKQRLTPLFFSFYYKVFISLFLYKSAMPDNFPLLLE